MTSGVALQVAGFCHKNSLVESGDKIVVGVSGGPDSLSLLHLLVNHLQADLDLTLIIAHLNHQLRGRDAEADETFVREIAARWQLPIRVKTCNVAALANQRQQSIEEAARQIRYAFLWQVAAEAGAHKIAVGHNADDQVETILMHFLRGAGLAGLRGMLPQIEITGLRLQPADLPPKVAAATPKLIRPLLETPRLEIEAYCREHQLAPRLDYSNEDTTFYRNRLRHELVPYLETYNPNIRQVLQNMAKVVTGEIEILNDHLDKAWQAIINHESPERVEILRQKWPELPVALKRSILRRAVFTLRNSLRDLDFEHIETAIAIIENGDTGTKITLPHGLLLTVGYHTIIIAPETSSLIKSPPESPHLATGQVVPITLPGKTPLPQTGWQLSTDLLSQEDLEQKHLSLTDRWEVYLDADIVGSSPILRPRQPGDTFCPLGMKGHSQKVNEFMINQKIPVHHRDHIPLLVANQQILWVCGYRPNEHTRIRLTTQHILHLKFERQ